MRRTQPLAALAAALLAAALSAQALHAYDLTGTWEGRYVCQDFDGTKFHSGNPQSTLLITQVGTSVYASFDGDSYLYSGGAIFDAANPDEQGELVLIQCPTDNLPFVGGQSEIVRAKVKVRVGAVAGKLKGLSVYEDPVPELGTCKYSFKRVGTEDPNVAACPLM